MIFCVLRKYITPINTDVNETNKMDSKRLETGGRERIIERIKIIRKWIIAPE